MICYELYCYASETCYNLATTFIASNTINGNSWYARHFVTYRTFADWLDRGLVLGIRMWVKAVRHHTLRKFIASKKAVNTSNGVVFQVFVSQKPLQCLCLCQRKNAKVTVRVPANSTLPVAADGRNQFLVTTLQTIWRGFGVSATPYGRITASSFSGGTPSRRRYSAALPVIRRYQSSGSAQPS